MGSGTNIDQFAKGGELCLFALSSWLATVAEIKAVRFEPVDVDVATKSVVLPGKFHKDPVDRMIVATARNLAAPLVTMDDKIRAYAHVKTIW